MGLPTWNPPSNPSRCADNTYSVAAAAELLHVYPGTLSHWLREGVLTGHQFADGTPWHINLDPTELARLQRTRKTRQSRRPAS
jgi:hypothetical protein